MTGEAPGTARGLIAWVLLALGWISLIADCLDLTLQGLAVAGVVLILLALWLLNVFTREFWNLKPRRPRRPWVTTIPETHPDALGSLDLLERAHRKDQDR